MPLDRRRGPKGPQPGPPKGSTWLGVACALIIVIGWSNSGHSSGSTSTHVASSSSTSGADQAPLFAASDDGDRPSVEEPQADDSDAIDEPSGASLSDDQAIASDSDEEATSYSSSGTCEPDYYEASSGDCVHRPIVAASEPSGATAQCNDGTYSFSEHHSGTCSHHGGVDHWL